MREEGSQDTDVFVLNTSPAWMRAHNFSKKQKKGQFWLEFISHFRKDIPIHDY